MEQTLPLDDDDRALLARKAARARTALWICAGTGLLAPAFAVTCLGITPTEWTAGTLSLAVLLTLALDAVPLLKGFDLARTLRRVERWRARGEKVRVAGAVTHKTPPFGITVGEHRVAAWERARDLAVGDEVTVEYLPLDGGLGGFVGVLRVDGQTNPYLENPWRTGPPTA